MASTAHFCRTLLALAGLLSTAAAARADAPAAADAEWFERDVLPVLRANCFECHSHSTGKMKGGLALDWRSGWATGGDSGPAVVPGKPSESLLIKAVRQTDADLKMPPKKRLTDAELAVLVEWVRRGAPDPRTTQPVGAAGTWWSLKPLTRPAVPPADRSANPIDAFVRATLKEKGLSPSPEADRRTLIRRVTFDLTGLPPTPEEVAAFAADGAADAYEKLVDRLLASPRYGERWARHWLDVVHFADTHGFEHDVLRPNAWRYRDYVIDALNRDTPWPRFVREQLAADALYPDEPKLTAALGFLGAGPYDQSAANTAPRSFEYLDRDDLVTQTIGAFAGATVGCARCHAHKFDPIPQEDYFALQAVFAGVGKGEIEYDEDTTVARTRARWQGVLAAADARDAAVLLAAENVAAVAEWEGARGKQVESWRQIDLSSIESASKSTLAKLGDGSVLASGVAPATDSYTVTGTLAGLKRVGAIRLDVLPDPSLPKGGPGRAENGNLHLSEFEAKLVRAGQDVPHKLKFGRATADWDQEGWTIAHAIDGKAETAWGIHPRESEPHYAVFELADPQPVDAGTELVVTLKQSHGRQHVIGRFSLSAAADVPADAGVIPAAAAAALKVPPAERSAEQRVAVAAAALRARASAELAKLPPLAKVYAAGATFTSDRGRTTLKAPRPVFVLKRGDLDKPVGPAVAPGALSAIPDLKARFDLPAAAPESARRAALAEWLVDRRNPLTWRAAANRVWSHHFGRGLCDTPNDLGRMGGVPSHPELLDWLACELRDGGTGGAGAGSLKHLHKLIVTSRTYSQSSAAPPEATAVDADNRLLWRFTRRRLEAEAYRDAVLAVSGRLDLTMSGPGVQQFKLGPKIQDTPSVSYTGFDWDAPGAGRRSVYRVVWRAIPDPFMDALDFPDASLPAPTRGFSASPQQALAMANNDFVLRHAQHLAARVERLAETREDRVAAAWRLALQRDPTPQERADFATYAGKHGLPATCRLILNLNEFLFVD
ncbi:MAG TPA: PSD1 and planctomycete cytochrome C domain-containing protein [Humisphaera sp.]